MDPASESKMNSEGGEGRPGERDSQQSFKRKYKDFDILDTIMTQVNNCFYLLFVFPTTSPSYVSPSTRRPLPEKEAICPSYQPVTGPERGRFGGDARRSWHQCRRPWHARWGGLPRLHRPRNRLGRLVVKKATKIKINSTSHPPPLPPPQSWVIMILQEARCAEMLIIYSGVMNFKLSLQLSAPSLQDFPHYVLILLNKTCENRLKASLERKKNALKIAHWLTWHKRKPTGAYNKINNGWIPFSCFRSMGLVLFTLSWFTDTLV